MDFFTIDIMFGSRIHIELKPSNCNLSENSSETYSLNPLPNTQIVEAFLSFQMPLQVFESICTL